MVVWYDNVRILVKKWWWWAALLHSPMFEAEITTKDLRRMGSNRKRHIYI